MSRPKNYLIDMDGVLVRGTTPIPGAVDFIRRLIDRGAKFLILTNNSLYTPLDLQLRLHRVGLDVAAEHIYNVGAGNRAFPARAAPPEHGLRARRSRADNGVA
jgi:NagD protein